MKKKKFLIFALAFALLLALAAFVACSGNVQYNDVGSDDDYTYDNSEFDPDLVQPDEGVTLDGVLDEAMYQNQRWLRAVKVSKSEVGTDYDAVAEAVENAAKIGMVVSFGEKGFYVGFDVDEAPGNHVWVNPDRTSYFNSCIELYMAAEGTTGLYFDNTFEIDLMPTGDMVFKKADGVNRTDGSKGWAEITAPYDTMPRLAATTKGGEVNTTDCIGYTLELFIPYNFLEQYGYETEGLKDGTSEIYFNPVNITSYNYDGTNLDADRWWFSTASQLDGDGWTNPMDWYHFDHGGLVSYDIDITQTGDTSCGSIMEYLGYDFAVADNTVTFLLQEAEGCALKTLSVNGSSVLGDVVYDANGRAQYVTTVGKVTGDLNVVAEFVPYSEGEPAVVTVKEGYTHGTVSLDKDSYVVGDPVTLTLVPEEGYVVSDVLANGESIFGIGLVTEDGGKTFTITTRCVETPLEFEVIFTQAGNVDGYQFVFATSNHVDGMTVRLRNAAGETYETTVNGSTATFNGIPAGLYTFEADITNYWLEIGEYFVSAATVNDVNISGSFPNGIYHQGDFTDLPAQSTSYYYRTVNSNISEEAWFAMKIAVDPDGAPRGQKYRIGYRMYIDGVECGPTLMWYTKYNSFRFSQCGLNWTEVDIPSEYNDAVWQRNGEDGMYMIVHFDPSAGTMGVYLALSDKSELYHLVDLQDSRLQGTITQFGAGVWIEGNSYCPAEIHDLRYGMSLSDCLGFDADDTITVNNPAVTGGLIALGKSSYVRGETVVLDVQPEEGYVLSALTVNGKDVFSEVSDNRLEFYLIDAELNIAATFEGYTPVSFTADVAAWKAGSEVDLTGATVTLSSSQIAYEGIEVSGGQISAEVRAGTYTASLSLDNYLTATVVVGDDGQVDEIVFEYDLFSVVQGAESNWDLTNQNHGSFTLKAVSENYSGISMNDSVNNFVFEINFTSVKTSTAVTRNEVRLLFDDGVRIGIDILSDGTGAKIESSDTSNGATTPAGDSTSMYPWARWYVLTTEEVKKYNSEEGILFKVVRLDDMVYVYLDGVLRAEKKLELSGKNYGSEPCYVGVYRWDGGLQKEYNYTFYTADTEASVTVKDGYTNGTVALDRPSYNVTDTVTVSFEPTDGFVLERVSVNGQDMTGQVSENTLTFICMEPAYEIEVSFIAMSEVSVTADVTAWRAGSEVSLAGATISLANSVASYQDIAIEGGKIAAEVIPGTYTATLSLPGYLPVEITVSEGGSLDAIVFEYDLFTVTSGTGWDLSEQNRGSITFNDGGDGAVTMNSSVNDFIFEINFTGVKTETANVVRNEVRLAFDNGKYLGIDLLQNGATGPYVIQLPSWDGNYLYSGYPVRYTLTEEEIAKYNTEEGISFKVMRIGGTAYVYLDDVLRATVELTGCENASAILGIHHWDGGLTVEYNFTFSTQMPAADVSVKEGYTNGTVALDRESYELGDLIVLTLTPETGYIVGDVLLNGTSIRDEYLTTDDGNVYYIRYTCMEPSVEFEVTFVAQTDIDVQVNFAESNNADGMSVRLTQAGGQAYTATVSNNAAAFEGLPAGFYTIEANIANYWLNAGTVYVYASMTAPTIDLSSYFEGGNVFFSGNFDNLPTQPEDTKADPYMEHYNAVNTTVEGDAWFAGKIMIAPDANLAATNYGVGYRFMIGGEEYNLMLVWKNGDKSFYLRLCRGGAIGGDAEAILLPSEYNSLINADDESGLTAEQLTGLYLVVYYDRAAGVFSVYVTMSDKTEIYHLADIEANGGDITQFGTALWIKKKVVATTTISEFRYGASLAEALGFDDGDTVTVTNPTVENGAIVLNQESYVRGDFVTLSVQPADGYVLSALTVNGKDVFSQIAYNQLAFYLTDAELNVAATFAAGTKVSVSADVAAWKAGNAVDLNGETVSLVSNAITYDLAIESGKLTAEVIQGTYTAILSLPGYKSQQVTIGAEGLAALTFEYDLFRANAGSWDLTNQNRGSFTLNNGSGGNISMNDLVDDFVFEINFTGAKTETASVVRNEVRLDFDNGTSIGFDLLQNGTNAPYIIQTGGHGNNFLYGWQSWYTLTDDEIAEYNAEAGISFKVVRQGGTAYIFLNDILRATIELTGCEDASAVLSVYHWDGGLTVNYHYTFSTAAEDIAAALEGIA